MLLTTGSSLQICSFKGPCELSENKSRDSLTPRSSHTLSLEVLWSHFWILQFSLPSPSKSQRASKHSWPKGQCHSCAPWPFLRHACSCDGPGCSEPPPAGLRDRELCRAGRSPSLCQFQADPSPAPEARISCNTEKGQSRYLV